MIVLAIFVLPPLGSLRIFGRLIADIFFSLLLISGIAAMSGKRGTIYIVAGIAFCALIFRWTDFLNPSNVLYVLDHFATIISIILFCIVLLTHVLKKGPITFRRIQGAIAVYLLLGLAWANAYKMIEHFIPGAFSGAVSDISRFSSWIYFSFVTLATLGYGDIAPVHPIARSLAVAEAITGQLYLTILIARLVSQELYYRTSREGEATRGLIKDKTHEKS
jgi:hypothetical protein